MEDAAGDFRFVMIFPSFSEWGAFKDAYEGSKVEEVDQRLHEFADCASPILQDQSRTWPTTRENRRKDFVSKRANPRTASTEPKRTLGLVGPARSRAAIRVILY